MHLRGLKVDIRGLQETWLILSGELGNFFALSPHVGTPIASEQSRLTLIRILKQFSSLYGQAT